MQPALTLYYLDAIVPFLDSDFESYLEEAYGYLDI